jgi:hypothetical protein
MSRTMRRTDDAGRLMMPEAWCDETLQPMYGPSFMCIGASGRGM